METINTRSTIGSAARLGLRLLLLVVLFMQASVLLAHADKEVYFRWGVDSDWDGDGGSVSAASASVDNKEKESFNNEETVVLTVSPDNGYYIEKVEWKTNDDNGFTYGEGTQITADVDGKFRFTLVNQKASLQVRFASSPNTVFVRWGIDGDWTGVGGTVSATGRTVSNKNQTSPGYNDNATATFTVTPQSGYVISKIDWKNDDNDGFGFGIGTDLGTSSPVSFSLTNKNASLQVRFALAATAQKSITAYYGTNAFDFTAGNPPNWLGGTVVRNGSTADQIGTSSYLVDTYTNSGNKTVTVTPGISPSFKAATVKWSEATWEDPRNITLVGSWTEITPDSNGQFTFAAVAPKSYVIYVQFTPVGAVGGNVGAWYGTNNTTAYDTPVANGSGGSVVKTSPGFTQTLTNRLVNGVTITSNSTTTFEVRPAANFKITSIAYGLTSAGNSVAVPANQTTPMTFSFDVTGGGTYVIWVVFTSTAATSFEVTGTVDTTTDALCTPNSINPESQTVNVNETGSFDLSTSTNCVIDCVSFTSGGTSGGCVSWSGAGSTYTTPPIIATSSFTVKFKPIGYTIDASIDASSPGGSGSITPSGTAGTGNAIEVAQASSQTFTITVNIGYSISHVYVTDANKSWVNHDLAPLSGGSPYTYTFNNIHANGSIKVYLVANVPASGYDYCQIPPFVQGRSSLIPNVLVIFDNSGSMGGGDTDGFAYYKTKSYGCTAAGGTNPTLGVGACTKFYGYFDPDKMYKTDGSNSNVYLLDNVTLNLSETSAKSGNYLNWRFMNKVDVIRKILVGGRVTSKGSSTLAGATRNTIATKFLYADNGKWVEYGTTEPQGLIQDYSDRVRFGLEVFGSTSNANTDGGTIVAKLGSTPAELIAAIEGPKTNPTTYTPIAESLYEAIRYYQSKPSAYNSSTDYGDATWNPAGNPTIQFPCQKHFVLLLTDGEANSTDKLPGLTNPTLNGYTDGVFNVNTWVGRMAAADKPTSNDGQYSDGVAYYGHVTDLRSSAFGNDIPGLQGISFYTVYAFGDGSGTKTLKTLSKYGGFESKNGNDGGTSTKYPFPDPNAEWDFNGDNDPDTYFEGDDGAVIGSKLVQAIQGMIAKVSSGTAASILANSEGSGANLLQAVFYPNKSFADSTEANWTGELHNLWYYIDPFVSNSTVREDTDYVAGSTTHSLNLTSDYVVTYYFDSASSKTLVNLSRDSDANGSGETAVSSGVETDLVKSIWRAGKKLWARDANDVTTGRKIYTACSIKDATCLACLGGSGCPTGIINSGLMEFTTANHAALGNYMQAPDLGTTDKYIDYVRGVDQTNFRNRTVKLANPDGTIIDNRVWKLGDIISSTPRLESNMKLNTYDLPQPSGYGDTSYGRDKYKTGFIYTDTYKTRGMVFAGANDGMLHAFKLGLLDVTASGDLKAQLTGSNLGEEAWGFIPSSALPYLKYMSDTAYADKFHVNYIDGTTIVADASIGISTGCSETTDYWKCTKDSAAGTNWRTVVIGSMGTGGATRIKGDTSCSNCVNTPIFDPKDNTKGFGYSSYFALDVTDPVKPVLLWEFSHPSLGFATSGPAIVKLNAADDPKGVNKNGRWFAVFASGPTGPISGTQFHGRSNQTLKVFVVDLKSGALMATIDKLADNSTLDNAFSGSIFNNVVDTDRGTPASTGFFQDDVVYIGYTQANSAAITAATTWTNGGLLRLLTGEKLNADGTLDLTTGWKLSKVIDGVGPVGSNIGKIVDRKNKNLWLYFGTGRYFDTGDDQAGQQRLYGIKEPCYKETVTHADGSVTKNDIDDNGCTTKVAMSTLDDQTSNPSATLVATANQGWYINLDPLSTPLNLDAERVLTDPVTTLNGVVFFTSFKPTTDVCSFGGITNIWAVGYDNGDAPPVARLTGKALLQLSTGSFSEIDLADAFGKKGDGWGTDTGGGGGGGRGGDGDGGIGDVDRGGRKTSVPMVGKPPGDAMPLISSSQNRPVRKLLHIREK